jgi:hypothetical protein
MIIDPRSAPAAICQGRRCGAGGNGTVFWEEKIVAPLIATPNVDKAIEDK